MGKVNECDQNKRNFILKSILSGCFAGFACIVCFVCGNYFFASNPGVAAIISATFFCLALYLIIYGEGELFTGNVMSTTFALMNRKIKMNQMINVLLVCYLANLVGAVLFSVLIKLTGVWSSVDSVLFLNTVVARKMSGTFLQTLIKGILCNWMVCLAVYVSTKEKNGAAKLILIYIIVFAFFISGYEHSVANFALFSLSLMHAHPDTITLSGAIANLIPTTLGNLIGGGVMVGYVYSKLHRNDKDC